MNPPLNKLSQLIDFLYKQAFIEGVLIIPMWPAQPWFTKALLMSDKAWILPHNKWLFLPGFKGNQLPLRNRSWDTLALRITNHRPHRIPLLRRLFLPKMNIINWFENDFTKDLKSVIPPY